MSEIPTGLITRNAATTTNNGNNNNLDELQKELFVWLFVSSFAIIFFMLPIGTSTFTPHRNLTGWFFYHVLFVVLLLLLLLFYCVLLFQFVGEC